MTARPFRSWLRASAAAIAVVGLAVSAPAAHAKTPRSQANHTFQLTVLGTTDLHGHGENWDYFKNAPYSDSAGNAVGLAKVSSAVNAIRAEKGRNHTLLIDAGDTIQGTPLSTYYAKVDPITDGHVMHPMALAMNAIGYDAAAVGNHEFNYGIPLLDQFAKQVNFPLLSANVLDDATGKPHFTPWIMKTIKVPGSKPIHVGIVGFTTPGVALWDKHNVQGKLTFPGSWSRRERSSRRSRPPALTSSSSPPTRGSRERRVTAPICRRRTPRLCWRKKFRASTRSSSGIRTATSRRCTSRTSRPVSRSCSASRRCGASG